VRSRDAGAPSGVRRTSICLPSLENRSAGGGGRAQPGSTTGVVSRMEQNELMRAKLMNPVTPHLVRPIPTHLLLSNQHIIAVCEASNFPRQSLTWSNRHKSHGVVSHRRRVRAVLRFSIHSPSRPATAAIHGYERDRRALLTPRGKRPLLRAPFAARHRSSRRRSSLVPPPT
jgi:hypothetical protein